MANTYKVKMVVGIDEIEGKVVANNPREAYEKMLDKALDCAEEYLPFSDFLEDIENSDNWVDLVERTFTDIHDMLSGDIYSMWDTALEDLIMSVDITYEG